MFLASKLTRRAFTQLWVCAPLWASASQDFKVVDNVELVLLDVSVRDRRGAYLTNLPKDAFRISVDGKPQTISQFARADAPVTIGLIVDNSGSMRHKRSEVVTAGLAFAKASNAQDEFFVVNFNDGVISGLPAGVPFTDNLQVLHNALYMGKSMGRTALYDAVGFGLKHLDDAHRDKRTLIVVSDGGDNCSKLTLAATLQMIQQSRATVYAIGIMDPEDRDLKPAVLKKFVGISGGEYFQPEKLEDVMAVMEKISKDIRSRYAVGFTPEGLDGTKPRHSISLTATSEGQKLIVHTRTFYYSVN